MQEISRLHLRFLILIILILSISYAVVANDRNAANADAEHESTICVPLLDGCSGNGPGPSGQIFSDNFNSGSDPYWKFDDGWYIVNYQGDIALRGTRHSFAVLNNYDIGNFAFRARFKRLSGGLHLCFRLKGLPDGLHRYFVSIDDKRLGLTKQLGNCQNCFHDMVGTSLNNLDPNWHSIEIRANGGNIRVFIDDFACICYTDNDPILSGGISLETLDNSDFLIDDVSISNL